MSILDDIVKPASGLPDPIAHERQANLKKAIIGHYSNGKYACSHCGFNDIRALSIDRINGGGTRHLREIKGNLYSWLIENNYPNGYQVLCMNCQWIKRAQNNETVSKYPRKQYKRRSIKNLTRYRVIGVE